MTATVDGTVYVPVNGPSPDAKPFPLLSAEEAGTA